MERWDLDARGSYNLRPYVGLRTPMVEPLGEATGRFGVQDRAQQGSCSGVPHSDPGIIRDRQNPRGIPIEAELVNLP